MVGFFLGGAAEGIAGAEERGIKRQAAESDYELRSRGLDIQEGQLDRQFQQDTLKEVDAQIANTMGIVAETIKSATAVGRDPAQIQQTVAPLVASAKALAQRVGRNPAALDAQVQAQITAPGLTETAKAAGGAAAVQTRAQVEGLTGSAPGQDISGVIVDPTKRADVENKLRDDYLKETKKFSEVRDSFGNLKTLPKDFGKWTGADDIVAVFAFMKIQDPGSVVMPGEAATVRNAGGVPEAVRGLYNNLLGGGTMGPGQREQIVDSAKRVYGSRSLQHDKTTTQFANIAKRQGLKVENVVVDLFPPKDEKEQTFDQRWSVTPGKTKWRVIP